MGGSNGAIDGSESLAAGRLAQRRHICTGLDHGARALLISTCALFTLATNANGAVPRGAARAARHRAIVCQRERGRTILRRGVVRVFKASGTVYGCVKGSSKAWTLWETEMHLTQSKGGAVKQVAGRYVAVETNSENQYGFDHSIDVFDLRDGASYSVAWVAGELGGLTRGEPPTPGPLALEAFVLAPDGRTARLYDTLAPPPNAGAAAIPTGQVLDLIGFHHFRSQLATSAPGGIEPASLAYDGHTVTWTQNGAPQSASV
jgi:hypothetical protein